MFKFLDEIDSYLCQLEGKATKQAPKGLGEQPKENLSNIAKSKTLAEDKIKMSRFNQVHNSCYAEGLNTAHKATNISQKKSIVKSLPQKNTLGSILYKLFVSKEYKEQGLDGWRDDKEKFKIDLINDIKTFLFTKWEKPWRPGLVFDETTGKILSGFRNVSGRVYKNSSNVISLKANSGNSPFFITLSKAMKEGGKILDKLKQVWIISYIPIYKDVKLSGKDDTQGLKPDYMLPQFHQVINVDYVDGIKKPTYKRVEFEKLELNEYVENFINELKSLKRLPKLHYDQADRCYYTHSLLGWDNESIHLVPINNFKDIEGYYSVLFHEITHSTMNPNRCGRGKHKNAGLAYANEELVAEMGAMIICEELGLQYQRQNSLTYLNGWLKQAKGTDIDSALIEAYAYACDAAEYLLEGIDLTKLVPKTLAKRAEEKAEETKKAVEQVEEKPKVEPKKELVNKKKSVLEHAIKSKLEKPIRKTKLDIIDFPIKDIHTDEKRFQNRFNAFSEDSKNRIIKALESGSFEWTKFDPVTLWKDPKNNKHYILSGHSRFAAFNDKNKEGFIYDGYGFANIPSRIFKGTEAQAIDFALNSNTLSTKETEVERAMYYNKQRTLCEMKKGLSGKSDCEKQVETTCKDAEGKNANYILNLSYLNPKGYLIDSLARLGIEKDNDSTNLLRTIANWIGEARRNNPDISNTQETEIAQFLINGGYGNKAGQFSNKTQFNQRLEYAFEKWKASGSDAGKPLNLANTLNKTSFEREFDERLAKAKEELDNAITEHEEKHKKYLFAVMEEKISPARMNELMKPIIAYVEKAKKEYERVKGQKEDVIKAAGAQTSLWGVNDVNEQFNKELDLLIQGKLPRNHVFYLGDMSDILNALSIKILPIEMQANRLYKKANQNNHLFDLALLKNLPEKLNVPIMVFNSKTVKGSLVVLIELASNDNNFVVAIEIGKLITKWSKGDVRINDVRSIYPKDTISDVLNWIEKDGLLLWVDKEKALDLLVRWRSNYAKATQQIKGCTNIIKNFTNPTPAPNNLNVENKNLFGFQPIAKTKKAKTHKLSGDIGTFLGDFDRNGYTIVLRGDKGAGKSRLLFQIINAFAHKRFKVAFLCLEMATGSSVTQRYKKEYITRTNINKIDITDQAPNYDELNAICKKYDVVAIDSWTKLKDFEQKDFDRLQKENPRTIIIAVFQSTTGKVTRGGNMPEYDAGTVIQVNKGGLAECEKNRYAETNRIFNVFKKQLEPLENNEQPL